MDRAGSPLQVSLKKKSVEFAPGCAVDSARTIEGRPRCSRGYIEVFTIEDEENITVTF